MSNWFYAANGQQQGPFGDAQFRDLIANGTVRADTLVWTEGMAGWQKATEVPGLMASAGGPSLMPHGGPPMMAAGGATGNALSIDFEIWDFTWRSLVLLFGGAFIIPAPWLLVWYLNWIVPRVQVPGRPNLSFTGSALTVAYWLFGFFVVAILVRLTDFQWLNLPLTLASIALYWLFIRWLIANLASNGKPLELNFSGSFWAYLGWTILAAISVITIIGWAWVYAAATRWFCRNIQGTRREVVFVGTGLEILWRSIVTVIACSFIIPIPWMYRWILRWWASQTKLVQRGTLANA